MKIRNDSAPPAQTEFSEGEKIAKIPGITLPESTEKDGKGSRDEHTLLPDGSRQVKRRKKRRKEEKHKKIYLFITAWIGGIVGLILLFQIKGDEGEEADASPEAAAMAPWKREFLKKHLPSVAKNFNGFIGSNAIPAQQQFIDRSAELAAKFTRFNQTHSTPNYLVPMRLINQNIIELQKEPLVLALETVWLDRGGAEAEAVHVWDGKEWRLDWENFAPFSTVPWTLFRSGVGKDEGDFRLLVRRRIERAGSDKTTFLFYFPKPFAEDSLELIRNTESPEVILHRASALAKELGKLIDNREKGFRPLESILGENDPDGMVRVWVNLSWEEDEDGERKMVLNEIKGVSWYGSRIQEVLAQATAAAEVGSEPADSEVKEGLKGSP